MTKRAKRSTKAGRRILDALNELASAAQAGVPLGARFTVRTVEVPDEPGDYDAASVRATRDVLEVSQAVFARLIGVSTKLVQAWEGGDRAPAPIARRLLDAINEDPQKWRAVIRPREPLAV